MKKVLLISNHVMHYRVSVYNYFHKRFAQEGYQLIVRADTLQEQNPFPVQFDFKEVPFKFRLYRDEIQALRPDVVILFVHLRDPISFPLLYWLKWRHIPVLLWTKGANLDNPSSKLSSLLYRHAHNLSDGIILYSRHEMPLIKSRNRTKVTVANNTINHLDFPPIRATKDELKRELGIPFKKIALFAGRMEIRGGRKKVDHAIQLFNEIDHPDYGLVLVGSGLSETMRMKLNPKNTVYLGEVYDPDNLRISKIFKMADVFLMPGHIGLGINQAFFWSLPVITEEGAHPPEIHYLVNGRNGFMVKENDLGALREKVLYLLGDDAERLRLGENAYHDITESASIDQMFQGFIDNVKMHEKGA